jgi:hypothetical protein
MRLRTALSRAACGWGLSGIGKGRRGELADVGKRRGAVTFWPDEPPGAVRFLDGGMGVFTRRR